jgi:hypothetical protein
VLVEMKGFPWTESFLPSGRMQIKGTKDFEYVSIYLSVAPPNKCTYTAAKVNSTFGVGPAGKPLSLSLTTTSQRAKLNRKASGTSAICAPEETFSASWTATDANGAVSAEL